MRFQAEIPSKDAQVLQTLMRELEVPTNAELLSHLLSITNWAVSERRKGRRLASIAEGQPVRELVSPLLERAAPETGLPSVEIDWTPQELASLDRLASQGPAKPNGRLKQLMKQTG
jgi:hypothetical protein